MEDWYTPDQIWSNYKTAKTREDFGENWVVKGRFHTQVPEDVKESFKTAEYLMAHAWYHYPLIDEALKKLLGILEMAVKKRCEHLGISLTYRDKAGRKRNKILARLIKDLAAKEPIKNQQTELDAARVLRNYYAHPTQHSFAGGMFLPKIIRVVNIINRLFLPEKKVQAALSI